MQIQKNPRIAIVGAGISGIFTAIELKKRGYGNVTLYEKADRITSLTTTFQHDGHAFDLSTKVIPAVGLDHGGVYPPLLAMLRETGVTLGKVVEPSFYDFARQRHMKIPQFMQQFGKLRILKEFARACALFFQIRQAPFADGAYQTDLLRLDETVAMWARRHDIESFGVFTNYLVDLFNQGPSHDLPANIVLMSRMHFAVPFLHMLLTKKGVKQFFKLFGGKDPQFQRFLDLPAPSSSYFFVKEGYEEFFRRLASLHGLQIHCQSDISGLERHAGGLRFQVNGGRSVECDQLIYCCPPPTMAQMSHLPQATAMLEQVKVGRRIRTWAFEVKNWDAGRFGPQAILVDGLNTLGMATPGMRIDGQLNYVAKEYADSRLLCSAVYLDDTMSEADALNALVVSLRRFNLELERVVTCKDFTWPYYFSLAQNASGMHAAMEKLQGVDGVYYCGESFFGTGVPTILEYSGRFVQQHFAGEP
ncbi:FAD-dependent oxidoreductase [Pseudoduganella sp. LjRoot289]|uniref:FAD-dependent oxidoreductase n=1 Tax=Pseudoduganella sp. LjRoot289 TaxID=3342314 RepID=UPI003ED08069